MHQGFVSCNWVTIFIYLDYLYQSIKIYHTPYHTHNLLRPPGHTFEIQKSLATIFDIEV